MVMMHGWPHGSCGFEPGGFAMVTIVHPTGFKIGVTTTAAAVATIEPRRVFGFAPTVRNLIPTPSREQLIVRSVPVRKVA
jgi:hypothetical protein